MTKIPIGQGQQYDTETEEIIVDGLDKPIKTKPVSKAAQEGAEEYANVLNGEKK